MNQNIDKEYQNIFRKLKEEKMYWNFEDFLKKTEEDSSDAKIIPLQKKSGGGNQKWFLMAASFAVILGLGIMMKFFNQDDKPNTNDTIANAITKQKNAGEFNENYDGAQIIPAKTDSIEKTEKPVLKMVSSEKEEDKIDKLLSKKSRIKKASKPRYVMHKIQPKETENNNPEYNPNYVIINGHKIESEEEAINVTKYSFQVFSKTLATTDKNINTDY